MAATKGDKTWRRISVRVSPDDYERLSYWAKRHDMTLSDYLYDAIETMLALENGDLDLPQVGMQRLSQVTEALTALEKSNESLEQVVTKGFESLMGLTRGSAYLADYEPEG